MVMQWTVNPPPMARLVRSQYSPPFQSSTAVVQQTVNLLVVGSIPSSGANAIWKCGRARLIATVLKTVDCKRSVSSNLTASANY
jgi:hypothetical protein